LKKRIDQILDNETRRLLKASNASALHEKELKKLEILAKIYQLIQGVKTPEDIPDELKNASTDALLKAVQSGSD
jgi:hypothetical protein